MVTVTIHHCAECGMALGHVDDGDTSHFGGKLYGDGTARCFPDCDARMRRCLNKRRGSGGRFVRK